MRSKHITGDETAIKTRWRNALSGTRGSHSLFVAFSKPSHAAELTGLRTFKEKEVSVYYLPRAERDRLAKQLDPYVEKQLSSFGDLGQKVKNIADEVNKKYPYVPDKGIM